MYVSEICAEGILITFPWWLKNVKSMSKMALFSNERHFEIWFPKKKTITFFWSKLSKLHQKDPILHVATTFSLKQGETRTSHGPIPHPLQQGFSIILPIGPWRTKDSSEIDQTDTISLCVLMYFQTNQGPNMKGCRARFGPWVTIWEPLEYKQNLFNYRFQLNSHLMGRKTFLCECLS